MREEREREKQRERALWWFICCSYIGIAHTHSLSGVDCCEKSPDVKGVILSEGFSSSSSTLNILALYISWHTGNKQHTRRRRRRRRRKKSLGELLRWLFDSGD